jgi:hypothetical protein
MALMAAAGCGVETTVSVAILTLAIAQNADQRAAGQAGTRANRRASATTGDASDDRPYGSARTEIALRGGAGRQHQHPEQTNGNFVHAFSSANLRWRYRVTEIGRSEDVLSLRPGNIRPLG